MIESKYKKVPKASKPTPAVQSVVQEEPVPDATNFRMCECQSSLKHLIRSFKNSI